MHRPVPASLLVSQPMMAFLFSEKLLSLLASRSSFRRRFQGSPLETKPSWNDGPLTRSPQNAASPLVSKRSRLRHETANAAIASSESREQGGSRARNKRGYSRSFARRSAR